MKPKFLDYHAKAPEFPADAVQQMAEAMKAGAIDEFGVKGINAFVTDRGEAYCLTKAPNADAVRESLNAHGMVLESGDVREVNSFV